MEAMGVAADAVGVFAAEVPVGSAACAAGLRQGGLIQQVDHPAVRTAEEFLGAVNAAPKQQQVELETTLPAPRC